MAAAVSVEMEAKSDRGIDTWYSVLGVVDIPIPYNDDFCLNCALVSYEEEDGEEDEDEQERSGIDFNLNCALVSIEEEDEQESDVVLKSVGLLLRGVVLILAFILLFLLLFMLLFILLFMLLYVLLFILVL